MIEKHYKKIVILLLLAFFLQTAWSCFYKSSFWDEPMYFGVGRYLWETGDFKINSLCFHPPLTFYINSLFLGFLDIDKSFWHAPLTEKWPRSHLLNPKYDPYHDKISLYDTKGKELITNQKYSLLLMLFMGRLPLILLAVGWGYLLFHWSSELFGIRSGLLSLFLFSFSPMVMGTTKYILTDSTMAAMFCLSLYCFWKFLKKPCLKWMIFSGIACGLTFASKFNGLTVPFFLGLEWLVAFLGGYRFPANSGLSIYGKQRRFRELYLITTTTIIISLIGLFVVWGTYGFEFYPEPELFAADSFYRNVPLPAPSYLRGIKWLMTHVDFGHISYFLGEYETKGWWYYFPVSFFLRNPLPLHLLLLFALYMGYKYFRDFSNADKLDILYLAAPIIAFLLILLRSSINIGQRHLLPIYSFIFMLAGSVLRDGYKINSASKAFIGMLCLWCMINTAMIFPHHNGYFNETIGSLKESYKYEIWEAGQSLPTLKQYMEEKNIKEIKLDSSGYSNPRLYGINYEPLPCEKTGGYIAVSAWSLFIGNKYCLEWLKNYTPVDYVGYSYLIYHIKS